MTETLTKRSHPSVMLGTASWGLKVNKKQAYDVLTTYYSHGFRWVDSATNYPIDRIPEHFEMTLEWLQDFHHDFPELKIFVKAGSATNVGEPTQLVNASYFSLIFELLRNQFQESFGGLGIHWDDGTNSIHQNAIVDLFVEISQSGYAVGLSGIAKPEFYSDYPIAKDLPWQYQVNLSPMRLDQAEQALKVVGTNFPNAKIFGYNLLGGISKKGFAEGENRLSTIGGAFGTSHNASNIEILHRVVLAVRSLGVEGLILGPTTIEQCSEWCTLLEQSVDG